MEKEYFYLNGETKVGPLSLEALKYAPVTPTTLVWTNTIPDWVEARTLPELESLFNSAVPPPPPASSTVPPQASYYAEKFGNPGTPPPMPENYLVWAILTTVLCCLPLGIVSIINATKVSTLYAQGDYAGAQKAADDAKKWAMWGAIVGGIVVILYIIFIVVIGVAGGLANM
ncbi:MAG: CD225/dispanin family protein [Tannerella sp.]|nr:CD225/dispanin family protein [Tannerella sp.]